MNYAVTRLHGTPPLETYQAQTVKRPPLSSPTPIGRFIVDFYCPEHSLIIELDGQSHNFQVDYDTGRTAQLEAQGYSLLRFTNSEVRDNLEGVLQGIIMRIREIAD